MVRRYALEFSVAGVTKLHDNFAVLEKARQILYQRLGVGGSERD